MPEEKKTGIQRLIESLQIFAKYDNGDAYPTHCEHDIITMHAVDPHEVSEEDVKRLDELGWDKGEQNGEPCFYSFYFGSC